MEAKEILTIKDYLEKRNIIHVSNEVSKMDLRKEGKEFSLSEHVSGMVYSMLSAQTVWKNIERHQKKIDALFYQFDVEKIKEYEYMYFYEGLGRWGCRGRLTKAQMSALHYNISVMEKIAKEYGSMDRYVSSKSLTQVIDELANPKSPYKLKYMATALVCEYLRNVGVDCFKPDVHIVRFFGGERHAISKHNEPSFEELYREMKRLSKETGLWMGQIDYIIWAYCATEQGEICTATPKCGECVVRSSCRYLQSEKRIFKG